MSQAAQTANPTANPTGWDTPLFLDTDQRSAFVLHHLAALMKSVPVASPEYFALQFAHSAASREAAQRANDEAFMAETLTLARSLAKAAA